MNHQPKILVVDDTLHNIKLLDAILAPRHYAVIAATSGQEALAKIVDERPDLVLLDILMPGIDGYEVCRRIRNDPATCMLPVVMITASGEQEKVKAIVAGADDFIAKPLNQPELLARVRSLLRIKQYHDTIQAQAAQLAEWNRTLEERVRQQVEALQAAQAQIVEKERLERELQVAYEIQVSILPRTLPHLAGYDFGARMTPARVVGGDFFDFIPLGGDMLGIAVGDVTDKGMPAALFMAQTLALLRAEAGRALAPRDVLQSVNRHLLAINDAGPFVTVLYGVLDRATGAFSCARAGHELPLICDPSGSVTQTPRGATLPLGIDHDLPLDEQTTILAPGSTLLLYTDGVTDARDPQGVLFGIARLQAVLCASAGDHGTLVCDQVLKEVSDYQGTSAQYDDLTVVAVHAEAQR